MTEIRCHDSLCDSMSLEILALETQCVTGDTGTGDTQYVTGDTQCVTGDTGAGDTMCQWRHTLTHLDGTALCDLSSERT
jgi:hypothetical protein